MQRLYVTLPTLLACIALSACGQGSVGKKLGLERQAPDEFRVLSRPPLSVPPEFNLRPPGELGESGGLIAPASQRGQDLVFGNERSTLNSGSAETSVMSVLSSDAASQTDQNFLARAGADIAKPDIRKLLRIESGDVGYEEDKSILEKLREPGNNKEPTVDAPKEAERIKENIKEGKSVSDGDIEVKEPKDRGILDKMDVIF